MAGQRRKAHKGPAERPAKGRPPGSAPPPAEEEAGDIRLNRYIARAGVCSRRNADVLIDKRLVKVNGAVMAEYGYRVQTGDVVEVNGRVISPREAAYLLLNKPKDVITTTSDERGRRTVLDLLDLPEEERSGLFPVGRLDRNTLGALLLTTDGELAHRLMHPRYEVEKLYVARTQEPVQPSELEQLERGVTLEDGLAKADQAGYVRPQERREIGVRLHEGRNRQIRRMLEALGHQVVWLERVQYAGLTTDGIRRGKWRRLFPHEVRKLRRIVHLK